MKEDIRQLGKAPDLFHAREGRSYWDCAWCGHERGVDQPGSYVKVANAVVGLVCLGECERQTVERVVAALDLHRQSVRLGATP